MFTQAASFLSTSMRAACSASSLLGYVEYTKQNSFVASTMMSPCFTKRDVTRLLRDAREPRAHSRITLKIETAFARNMRIRIQRNIGERILPTREPFVLLKLPLHHSQRRISFGVMERQLQKDNWLAGD